ncbi:tetratricopeptide repeat protein, partial [bacterium]
MTASLRTLLLVLLSTPLFAQAPPPADGPRERALAEHTAGKELWELGKKRKALKRFRAARRLDPGNPDILASLVEALEGPEAIGFLEGELRRDPRDFGALVLLASAYLQPASGNKDRATELLERAAALEGPEESHAWALLQLASTRREEGRFDEALGLNRRLLVEHKAHPAYPTFFLEAAQTQAAAKSHEKARQLVRRGCALLTRGSPLRADTAALGGMAQACFGLGDYGAAETLWTFLLAQDPADDFTRSRLAGLHRNRGDLDAAEALARGFAGPYAPFFSNEVLAHVYAERGRREACEDALRGALAALRAMLRDAPADPGLYIRGAALLSDLRVRPDLAKELAERAQKLSPGPEARATMGFAALAAGEPDEAIALLAPAAEESPYSSWMRVQLGRAYAAKGDSDAARRTWREGLVINPSSRAMKTLLKGRRLPGEGLKLREDMLGEPASVAPSTAVARIAVLPMGNLTNDLKGPGVLRALFHERLGRRGYLLAPLEDVDRVLRERLGVTDGGQLAGVTPQRLGEALGV